LFGGEIFAELVGFGFGHLRLSCLAALFMAPLNDEVNNYWHHKKEGTGTAADDWHRNVH
jgi:hypothetical protein